MEEVVYKISHHHCICISANRKGERGREGRLEDAHMDSAREEQMDNGVLPTDQTSILGSLAPQARGI